MDKQEDKDFLSILPGNIIKTSTFQYRLSGSKLDSLNKQMKIYFFPYFSLSWKKNPPPLPRLFKSDFFCRDKNKVQKKLQKEVWKISKDAYFFFNKNFKNQIEIYLFGIFCVQQPTICADKGQLCGDNYYYIFVII